MNYEELRRYIRDLQQSGFDVVRLRVQLNKKLSYPLITLIMAVLADSVFHVSGEKRSHHWRGGGGGNRRGLYGGVAIVRGHGRPQPDCRRHWPPGRRT